MEFEELEGGHSNQVRRYGNTVLRQCGRWSPFVQHLLQFLEAKGFQAAPQFLGSDGITEKLSFLEGDVGNEPLTALMRRDEIVIEAAQLLRQLHDITQDFLVPPAAQFLLPLEANQPHEVICHNDFAPYNCVFKDGHLIGIIDFDTAAPGQRLWDIAYAVYRFAPLVTDAHCQMMGWDRLPERSARLKLFCDAYGLAERSKLITTVLQRLEALIRFMRDNHFNIEHIPLYLADIAYIQANQQAFEAAL